MLKWRFWQAKVWLRYQLTGKCGLACGETSFRHLDGTPFTEFVPEADCPIHDRPGIGQMPEPQSGQGTGAGA
jgi:hypothetical protein